MKATKLRLTEMAGASRVLLLTLGTSALAGVLWAQSAPPAAAPAPAPTAPVPGMPGAGVAPGKPPMPPFAADPSAVPPPPPRLAPPPVPGFAGGGVPGAGALPSLGALPPTAEPRTTQSTRGLPPTAGNFAPPDATPERQLSSAITQEETNPDSNAAKEAYKSLVLQFDQQRKVAAQAIFRLGECYRRLGRLEEARAQYGRILREFVDFPELAQKSMRLLSETARQANALGTRPGGMPSNVPPSVDVSSNSNVDSKVIPEMKALVEEQIRVRKQALTRAREQFKTGTLPASEVEEAEIQLLQLNERLVALTNAEIANAERNRATVQAAIAAGRQAGSTDGAPAPRDPHVAQIDSEIRNTLNKISELETEQRKQTHLLEMLQRPDPESLPSTVVNDSRYTTLKGDYEATITQTVGNGDPKAAEKKIAEAKQQIHIWIRDVLIPELKVSEEYREKQLEDLRRRVATLNDEIISLRQQEQAKAAARRM